MRSKKRNVGGYALLGLAGLFVACMAPAEGPTAPAEAVASLHQALTTTFDPALCGSTAGVQANAAWPSFGACPTGRRSSPQVGTTSGFVNWTAPAGVAVQSSPVIGADGSLYVGSNDGNVYSFTSDGVQRWKKSLVGQVHTTPAIAADGTVIAVADLTGVFALNPADGSTKWQLPLTLIQRSSPTIGADGSIWFATSTPVLTGTLYAVRSSGSVLFRTTISSGSSSAPAIGPDGTVYLATDGVPVAVPKALYAIDPKTGASRWSVPVGGSSTSGAAVAPDGTIYVGSGQASVKAFNADGSVKWTYSLTCALLQDCNISATPAIGPDGTVFVGSNDGRFFAIDPTGKLVWSKSLGTRIEASAAVDANGTAYVGVVDNRQLFGLKKGGGQLFTVTTGGAVRSSPSIGAFGTVYVGSDDGKVYSVGERFSGFVQGTKPTPIGTCNDNQVAKGTTTQVCLSDVALGAATVNIYVNGHLTPSTNNCVSLTINDTVEIRSFEYAAAGQLLANHTAFLTTTAHTKHCPIYDNVILGGPGDDVLIGTSADEYISGGPGIDYIAPGGGNDVVVGGDDPDTLDLGGTTTPPTTASLKIIGADLTQDRILGNFDPSLLPQGVFDTPQSCSTPACQSVPQSFERIYTQLEGQSGFAEPFITSVRQTYDIGGGYIAVGSRGKADGSGIEGLLVKLTPQGDVVWKVTSTEESVLSDTGLHDVQVLYDINSKRVGYITCGHDNRTGRGVVIGFDLSGKMISYDDFTGSLLDRNEAGQIQEAPNFLQKIVTGPGFILAAGSTASAGATLFPDGTSKYQDGGKGFVVVLNNGVTNAIVSRSFRFSIAAGFAPDGGGSSPGTTFFNDVQLLPPSGSETLWRAVLGGGVFVPAQPGAQPTQTAFTAVVEIPAGASNLTGDRTLKPLSFRSFLSGAGVGQVTALADMGGSGLMLAGATDQFRQSSVFEPTTFLKPTDYTLADTLTSSDPAAGAFFTPAQGFEQLGGYTSTEVSAARRLSDGSLLLLGSTEHPWSDSLLTTSAPVEMIDGDFANHALFVHTDASGNNRVYRSYGHDKSQPATHVINTTFTGGEPTPDRGFVASGIACPGADHPCHSEMYLVKMAPDLSSPGMSCSCSDGIADCGESPTGYASATATHPGDCGGPCAPCAIDCGDGAQDHGEDNIDCGGSCSDPRFTPTHQASVCKCTATSCDDSNPCTSDACDLSSGCQYTQLSGTSCGSGKVCSAGSCIFDCSSCPAADQCHSGTCSPGGGCKQTPLNGTPCSGGQCQNGTCTALCTSASCDDGNPCTTDSCDPAAGCSNTPASGAACTAGGGAPGQCQSGTCVASCDPSQCDDNNPCTDDGCNAAGTSCQHTNVTDGTTSTSCGTNQVCLGGSCKVPNYVEDVTKKVIDSNCGGCHGPGSPCFGGSCFDSCYAEATKTAQSCKVSAENGHPVYSCMSASIAAGVMPPNCDQHPMGCPTPEEIAIIQAWAAAGAPYDANNGTPAPCP